MIPSKNESGKPPDKEDMSEYPMLKPKLPVVLEQHYYPTNLLYNPEVHDALMKGE